MNKTYNNASRSQPIVQKRMSRQEAAFAKQKNQLNVSKSKMQYSFARASRFSQQNYFQAQEQVYNKKKAIKQATKNANVQEKSYRISKQRYRFYNLPSQLSKRATSFGYGERSSIETQKMNQSIVKRRHSQKDIQYIPKTPTPTRYNIVSCFQKDNKILGCKDKGIKFKCGRQQAKYGYSFNVNGNPGPGNYHPNPEVVSGARKIAYSLGKRFQSRRCKTQYGHTLLGQANHKQDFTICNDATPGPIYQIPTTMLDKNKVLSKYIKKCSTRIVEPSNFSRKLYKTFYSKNQNQNQDSSVNDDKPKNRGRQMPGPQQYSLSVITRKGDGNIGHYGPSTFMTREKRFKDSDTINSLPGPGQYEVFSEFIQQ